MNLKPDIRGITRGNTEKDYRLNFENIDYSLRDIANRLSNAYKIIRSTSNDVKDSINSTSFSKASDQTIGLTDVIINNFALDGDDNINFGSINLSTGIFTADKKCLVQSIMTIEIESTLSAGMMITQNSTGMVQESLVSTNPVSAITTYFGTKTICSTYNLDVGDEIFTYCRRVYGAGPSVVKGSSASGARTTWTLNRLK